MRESFLHLTPAEQSEIYRTLAPQLGRAPSVLEKDVWVCWVLMTLFSMPGRLQMAFKGGTSLSKVFGAIARFSEDVDITLDYRALDDSFDPFVEGVSKNQLRKYSESLKAFVADHAHNVVLPYFREKLIANSARFQVPLHSARTANRCGFTIPRSSNLRRSDIYLTVS